MPILRIASQDANSGTTNSGAASATYPARPKAGNLLIAITVAHSNGSQPVANPGWKLAVDYSVTFGVRIEYKVANGGEPTVVSTINDPTASSPAIAIYEYTGFAGTPTLDRTNGVSTTASLTVPIPAPALTSMPNELLIAGIDLGGTNTISSWTNGFTTLSDLTNGSIKLISGQLIVSATGAAYGTTLTTAGSTLSAFGAIATFHGSQSIISNRGLRPHLFSPGLAR